MKEISLNVWEFIQAHPWEIAGSVIGAYIILKFSLWCMRYWYVSHVKNVYIRIIMPREDSPKDKEREIEKDFREKIAIMEQFYRGIGELKELNLKNIIRSWLFHADVISFEIIVQEKMIDFYVVTVQHYSQIIEKQITSFYPNAEIQIVEPYQIDTPDKKMRCFFGYQAKPFWFPIKTYKTIENDPINGLTNIFSKIQTGEKAAIQFIMRPMGKSWQKKGEKYGSALFQGRKMSDEGIKGKIPGLKASAP